MWADLYPWLVGAIGGFIGSALLLPTKLGDALIQFRTNKALESFKAVQVRELENIKERLSHLGDRGRRSNEMEFQAIEKVWKAFVEAWLSTNGCVGEMIRYPAFATMSHEEIRSFARGSGLDDDEQASLLAAEDKSKEYLSIRRWKTVSRAGADIFTCRLMLRQQRIFMPAELTKDFETAIETMNGVQVERRLSLENPNIPPGDFGGSMTNWTSAQIPTFENLAEAANKRLFRDEKQR